MAFVAAALLTAVKSEAQNVLRYRTGGPWEDVSDGTTNGWGLNPADPGVDVPMGEDEARINWAGNVVTLDYEAPTFRRLLIGVDEGGVLEVGRDEVEGTSGVLTTTQDVVVGNNGFIEGTMVVQDGGTVNVGRILWVARGPVVGDVLGFLNIESGGVVNVASHLWWGSTGEAEVNISGTLNQTGGILGLGSADFNTFGGSAVVNVLDGGEFNLNNIHAGGTQLSIQPGSSINIQGTGRVTLPGDFTEVLEGYRDSTENLLLGNGVPGAVNIEVVAEGSTDGDYNADGAVDAIDYAIWRENLGGDSSVLNGNGSGSPTVVTADFTLWMDSYGGTASLTTVVTAAAPSAVGTPEPGTLVLTCLISVFSSLRFGRPRRT